MYCLIYWEEAACPGLTQLLIRLKQQGLGMAIQSLYSSALCVESLFLSSHSALLECGTLSEHLVRMNRNE